MTANPEPLKLSMNSLKQVVADGGELSKGARIFDDKGLVHLSRFQNKLFAEAKGSGASPYKVQAIYEQNWKGRCSCMAARSRPFCKHSAALLVAWARAPEAFVVSDVAPAAAGGEAKKKASVKTGKTDTQALMRGGVEQVAALVKELALSGVAALGQERAEQISTLGTSLRESRLRRLSARVVAVGEKVGVASSGSDTFDASEYAETFADMVLTVRKLEKHLAGEALDDVYVEELIGKTWTKKDRQPVSGLDLVEYAFSSRVTADDFMIRESRFLDLQSGQHYSEKQILPGFLVKRTDPKKSHAGWLLQGAQGSQYPSFAPHRLDLESQAQRAPLSDDTLGKLVEKCLPSVTAALSAFQDRKKDVFAPDTMPVAVKVDTVLAEGVRLQAVDAQHGALFLPEDSLIEEQLAVVLRGAKLEAFVGDVALDGALPTLFPLAAVVSTPQGRALRSFGGGDAATLLSSRKVRVSKSRSKRVGAQKVSWADTARAVGISSAAIALGEVRDELAQVLVSGLGGLVERFAEPLVARLNELGMHKPAEVLRLTAQKADPAERLDDFVKLYQVLGIALTRLVGAAHVDRSTLENVPTFESVQVRRSTEKLIPTEIAARVAEAKFNRYEAAARYAAYYDQLPAEELAQNIYPTWADGSAQPYVARVFASRPEQALAAATRALGLETERSIRVWRRSMARMARLTAVKVLEAVGNQEAARLLTQYSVNTRDAALRSLAQRALKRIQARMGQGDGGLDPKQLEKLEELIQQLMQAHQKHDRSRAALELARNGFVEAIPQLRASFAGDISSEVRESSAHALGMLGDTEALDGFVRMVNNRREDPEAAKLGAYALAHLGDVRGIDVLLEAWAEGWQPAIVSEAMKHIGMAALEPLLDLIEQRPDLVKRKAALNVIEALDAKEVGDSLAARVEPGAEKLVEKATLYATLAANLPPALEVLNAKVLQVIPELSAPKASKEHKALLKKLK